LVQGPLTLLNMVRRASSRRRVSYAQMDQSDTEEEQEKDDSHEESDEAQEVMRKPAPKSKMTTNGKKRANFKRTPVSNKKGRPKSGPRGKISPSKTPLSKRNRLSSSYNEDDDEDEVQVGRHQDDSDISEDDYEREEENEENDSDDDDGDDEDHGSKPRLRRTSSKVRTLPAKNGKEKAAAKGKKGTAKQKTPASTSKEQFPPVKVMVVESIKALKDPPRLGSTLGAIKETILLNWDLDMRHYDARIKKFLLNALESGDLVQPRAKGLKGLRGRFSVPGMKTRKKKARLSKKLDEDVEDYTPAKTARDEDRERAQEELERRREERKMWEEEKAIAKENRPKKKMAPRRTEWEVESIKARKEVDGEVFYMVKFKGWAKPQWEPEENVEDCVFVDEFERARARRAREKEQAEAKGSYEVRRIIDVNFLKVNYLVEIWSLLLISSL